MTKDNRIWVLMSRHLSGEATAEEAEELKLLLESSPTRSYQLSLLHSYFSKRHEDIEDQETTDSNMDERFLKIVDQPVAQPVRSTPVRTLFSKKLVVAAAIAGLLLITGVLIYRSSRSTVPALATSAVHSEEVLARAGTRTRLVLPDGTQVWLNSSSKLRYSEDFNVSNREVTLEGEAYFDVAKNVSHPFVVHAFSLDVTVLGTVFTVKSYPQDPTVETTLLKGAIEVSRKYVNHTARLILRPNEKLILNKLVPQRTSSSPNPNSGLTPLSTPGIAINSLPENIPDSNKTETAWLYNRLVFEGDSFPELAEKMERWYNVRISLMDKSLASFRFGGAFANESVEQALKALQLTAAFTYKIKGKEIELYAKQ